MKIEISRTGFGYLFQKYPVLRKKWGVTEETDKEGKDWKTTRYYIEITTIEQLVELSRDLDPDFDFGMDLIFTAEGYKNCPTIEIYDDYRE